MRIAMAVFLAALMGLATGITYEETQWWMAGTLPRVCNTCPEVVQYYMDMLNQKPQLRLNPQAIPLVGYEEVLPLNESHELIVVYGVKDGQHFNSYNKTKLLHPLKTDSKLGTSFRVINVTDWPTEEWEKWPMEVSDVPPFEIYSPPSLLELIQALEARMKILEEKLDRLCTAGIVEVC